MYGISTYIYHKLEPNVRKYAIQGASLGYIQKLQLFSSCQIDPLKCTEQRWQGEVCLKICDSTPFMLLERMCAWFGNHRVPRFPNFGAWR